MKPEYVDAPGDPRLADYRDVRDRDWLERRDLFLAEGREVVSVLFGSDRFRARSLVVTESSLDAIGSRVPADLPVYVVSLPALNELSGVRFHQGCVALGEPVSPPAARDLLAREGARTIVVLEDVTDPDNVGSVFRNAFAFGVDAVLLTERCASPLYRKAIRTSLAASLRVPFAEIGPDAPRVLEEAGYSSYALTPDPAAAEVAVSDTDRLALLVGNEGRGLSSKWLAAAEARVRIPMVPGADSLNVATATGIALYVIASTRGAIR